MIEFDQKKLELKKVEELTKNFFVEEEQKESEFFWRSKSIVNLKLTMKLTMKSSKLAEWIRRESQTNWFLSIFVDLKMLRKKNRSTQSTAEIPSKRLISASDAIVLNFLFLLQSESEREDSREMVPPRN